MHPITAFLTGLVFVVGVLTAMGWKLYLGFASLAGGVVIAMALRMADAWQTFVILRMGKLHSANGAGLFAIIPVLDPVVAIINGRLQTTKFNAEQALTRDTAPVNADANIFWHVHDAQKAARTITDYRQAIDPVAQTSLREMIGSSMLAALLFDRKVTDEQLKLEIGAQKGAPGHLCQFGGDSRRGHSRGPCSSVTVAACTRATTPRCFGARAWTVSWSGMPACRMHRSRESLSRGRHRAHP